MTTRHRFDEQLDAVRCKMVGMITAADQMIADALVALETQDVDLADCVLRRDGELDRADVEVEDACLRMLALQQPVVASDLRFIGTAIKSVDDVERIGDHAVNIAKTAQRMAGQGVRYDRGLAAQLPELGAHVRAMLRETGAAFAAGEGPDAAGAAERVIRSDDRADELYADLRRDWHRQMQEEPQKALLASSLLFVAHYLERVGDHCTNVAERILFYKTGTEREVNRC